MSDAKAIIQRMPQAFDPAAAGDTNAIVQYAISTPMVAEIKAGACTVYEGKAENPDVTIHVQDDDLVALLTGKLGGMTAFMTGRLKVDGNLILAQRLPKMFDQQHLS